MLTANDLIFAAIVPLILGLSVAFFLKKITQSRYSQSIGALFALVAGYFGHFAKMNFAYAEGETINSKLAQSFYQTVFELLNPMAAIQWIPLFAVACLAITIIIESVGSEEDSCDISDSSPRSISSHVLIYGLLVVLTAAAVVRLLWSSVYFTDRYALTAQIGYTIVPALLIGAVWLGGFNPRQCRQRDPNQLISRWASVSTVLLSASALVLLASSGSFTIGLLQIPVLSAAIVSAVFVPTTSNRWPLNSDAWLIASAVCCPVAIGFFFAKVRWETAVLFAMSSILVTTLTPLAHENILKKVGIAIANCLPAIAAAIWAAVLLGEADALT